MQKENVKTWYSCNEQTLGYDIGVMQNLSVRWAFRCNAGVVGKTVGHNTNITGEP